MLPQDLHQSLLNAESEGMTEEAVRERLAAVTGPKRDPFLLIQDAKSYGGKGGKLLDNFLTTVSKTAESEGMTEEAVRERLVAVKGPKRDQFLHLQDAKSWGGKGGRTYDDWNKVVGNLMEAKGLTKEAAEGELGAVQGQSRHPLLISSAKSRANFAVATAEMTTRSDELDELLADSMKSSDPTWTLEVWDDKVWRCTGLSSRDQASLSKHRAQKFKVGSAGSFRELNEGIRGLTLPKKPPRNTTTLAKDEWRTDCAKLKFTHIQKEGMIHTYVYYKYQKKKERCPNP
jgi:hypothetical protein